MTNKPILAHGVFLPLLFCLCLLPAALSAQAKPWPADTTLLASPPTLEELRDKLAANTKELSPDLGSKRLPPEEVQAALTALSTAEDILAKNVTEAFRVWTLKRKAAALITLAYERTPDYYPALVGIVEELDSQPGCEAIMIEAERHVLIIAAQLAVAPMATPDGKKLGIALKPLAERMTTFAQQHPGRESERMIRYFINSIDRTEFRRDLRDSRLAQVVPVFADYFAKREDRESLVFADELQRVQRRLELPGKTMLLDGFGLDGTPFDQNLLKDKVVLVQFWGTWCQWCMREMPLLIDLYEKYRSEGFEIVGINTAVQGDERPEAVMQFINTTTFGPGKKKMAWPMIHEGLSAANKIEPISRHYNISELPVLVLIGRNGKVLSVNPSPASLETSIQEALPPVSLDDLTDAERALAEAARKKREKEFEQEIKRELEAIGNQ